MNNESQKPLISCICITKNRSELLFKTIILFERQNYPNKELVISYPKTDNKTKSLLDYFHKNTNLKILIIERSDHESIGTSRNSAIAKCNGEYICTWDDDDLYDFTRLTFQYHALISNNYDASILIRILLYHSYKHTAYLSFPSHWGCTLLCRKDHIINYPCADKNEFEYAPVLNYLKSKNLLLNIGSSPMLYTYIFHGDNVMKYTTFLYLINQSFPVQEEISKSIETATKLKFEYPV